MKTVMVLGIVMIVLSVVLLVLDFLAYAKKRLTDGIGLIWALFGLMLLLSGILMLTVEGAMLVLLVILAVFLIFFLFGISQVLSVLVMKNQELAMQVSLLNQENEGILQELEQMKGSDSNER